MKATVNENYAVEQIGDLTLKKGMHIVSVIDDNKPHSMLFYKINGKVKVFSSLAVAQYTAGMINNNCIEHLINVK